MADLIKQDLEETVTKGFLQYKLTEVYRVTVPNRTSGPVFTLSNIGLPRPRSSKIVEGVTVWLRSRKLTTADPSSAATYRQVVCTWTNNTQEFSRDESGDPVSTPDQSTDRVEVSYVNHSEPITDAVFLNATLGVPFGHPDAANAVIPTPPWLRRGRIGAVTNSAGRPVFLEREVSSDRIVVWRTVRNWDNSWEDYNDSINSDSFSVIQRDSDGIRLQKDYAPHTMRIENILKRDVWRDGKLYFQVGFPMIYNRKTWVHSEVDRGTERRVQVNAYRPDGERYTQEDLDELGISEAYGFGSIMTDHNSVAISEPIKFNGTGAEMPLRRLDEEPYDDNKEVFLNYLLHDVRPFSPLVSP